jgi:hypothetical protein
MSTMSLYLDERGDYAPFSSNSTEPQSLGLVVNCSADNAEIQRIIDDELEQIVASNYSHHNRQLCPLKYISEYYDAQEHFSDVTGTDVEESRVATAYSNASRVTRVTFGEEFYTILYVSDLDELNFIANDQLRVSPMPEDTDLHDPRLACEGNVSFQVPDTRLVKESELPFTREGCWNLSHAVGLARAVYLRFLVLLDDYVGMEINKAVGKVMPEMIYLFFF